MAIEKIWNVLRTVMDGYLSKCVFGGFVRLMNLEAIAILHPRCPEVGLLTEFPTFR